MYIAIAAVIGIGLGYLLRKLLSAASANNAERHSEEIVRKAKNQGEEILLKSKTKANEAIDQAKSELKSRYAEISDKQKRVEKREELFDQRLLGLEDKQDKLSAKEKVVETKIHEVDEIKGKQSLKLEEIAKLSKEEAADQLMKDVEERQGTELQHRIDKLQRNASDELEKKARDMMLLAMQRLASSQSSETTTTIVPIASEDMKGRIIGKEGRNIKAIESMTGVEIVVDDTPDSIVVSGFSPIRRHLAKISLEMLMKDGRIHPARIEETVERAKSEMAATIRKAGEDAAFDVGVSGLDTKLLQVLGRLKYRTSYGQNQLMHAKEVSLLAGMLAEQLGADIVVAKKGGLLHDIGKAVDFEVQGGHPEIGYDIMKKFGLPEEIAYISKAHHEDAPKTIEGAIVKVADALSGARPGARKDTLEQYIQRLQELEGIATSFEGVEKSYAIQAGRELRVFVNPENITDIEAGKLARNIADQISDELSFPGEIKVMVIRENRIIQYAR